MKALTIGLKIMAVGTSLVIQWLTLQASIAGSSGLILGQGIKILHAAGWPRKKRRKPDSYR